MRIMLFALLVSACAPVPLRGQTGATVDPPGGYVEYCIRHPERQECGGGR